MSSAAFVIGALRVKYIPIAIRFLTPSCNEYKLKEIFVNYVLFDFYFYRLQLKSYLTLSTLCTVYCRSSGSKEHTIEMKIADSVLLSLFMYSNVMVQRCPRPQAPTQNEAKK